MEVVHERCAGLDVHKRMVVACVLWGARKDERETRTFSTMTADLRMLRDWLLAHRCSAVAMESTGSYWKPIFNLLEDGGIQVMVVNAAHIKTVPGRKTDVCDAQWIADLLRHGLLRGSFIPDRNLRELRELVRYRRSVIQERTREVTRLQKVLEGANIKIQNVATDVLGVSCQAMLKAMVEGNEDPEELAALAVGRLKKKRDELVRALEGLMGDHQRFLLKEQLLHIEELHQRIERLRAEIARRMRPFEAALAAIDEIPGIARIGAEEIIAETGVDMNQFPSAAHISSWAKVCPGNHESAGRRLSGKTGKGNPWLRSTLVEAARAASHCKSSYLAAQYRRTAARRGANRAAVTVAHSMLVIVYRLLKDGVPYEDLGIDYFDRRDQQAVVRRATQRLEALGFKVDLTPTSRNVA